MPAYRAPTPGTRIAVWMFPALTLWLGLGYLFAPRARFSSTAFTAAKEVMPLEWWGAVFLLVAGAKVLCLVLDSRRGYIGAMCVGMGLYAIWAFLFLVATIADPRTSPGAAAWPTFVVAAHAATLATLSGKWSRP